MKDDNPPRLETEEGEEALMFLRLLSLVVIVVVVLWAIDRWFNDGAYWAMFLHRVFP